MLNTSLFYRVGNALVSEGIVIIGDFDTIGLHSKFNSFCIHMPGLPGVKIQNSEHPDEYEQYLSLYTSAPLLSSHLTIVQEVKNNNAGNK